jgi:hypothetical protein
MVSTWVLCEIGAEGEEGLIIETDFSRTTKVTIQLGLWVTSEIIAIRHTTCTCLVHNNYHAQHTVSHFLLFSIKYWLLIYNKIPMFFVGSSQELLGTAPSHRLTRSMKAQITATSTSYRETYTHIHDPSGIRIFPKTQQRHNATHRPSVCHADWFTQFIKIIRRSEQSQYCVVYF